MSVSWLKCSIFNVSIKCNMILYSPSSWQDCDIVHENTESSFKGAFKSYLKILALSWNVSNTIDYKHLNRFFYRNNGRYVKPMGMKKVRTKIKHTTPTLKEVTYYETHTETWERHSETLEYMSICNLWKYSSFFKRKVKFGFYQE